MDRVEPGNAHHALIADLHATLDRYTMMPAIERVAVVSQCLGQVLADVSGISAATAMQVVSRNLEQGNRHATGAGALVTVGRTHDGKPS